MKEATIQLTDSEVSFAGCALCNRGQLDPDCIGWPPGQLDRWPAQLRRVAPICTTVTADNDEGVSILRLAPPPSLAPLSVSPHCSSVQLSAADSALWSVCKLPPSLPPLPLSPPLSCSNVAVPVRCAFTALATYPSLRAVPTVWIATHRNSRTRYFKDQQADSVTAHEHVYAQPHANTFSLIFESLYIHKIFTSSKRTLTAEKQAPLNWLWYFDKPIYYNNNYKAVPIKHIHLKVNLTSDLSSVSPDFINPR